MECFEETAAYPVQQLAMSAYKDPIGSVKKAMDIYASMGLQLLKMERQAPRPLL